jgi:DNA-binding HxlR family transcriptional regulator
LSDRSLARVGAWWSILILRDAPHGYRRFDEFQESLGVATGRIHRRYARRKAEAGAA